ncbi:hypothetical protein N0V85_008014 [Neurospora sp. IMI 360204]|nr:hypothetical protein N0V85_008014 [Neurospora sp. IMI 360204]
MDEPLSPVWKSLPFELVQEILNHLFEDILKTHNTYHIWSLSVMCSRIHSGAETHADRTKPLLAVWAAVRQNWNLFHSYKSRIERYFLDEWLSTMVFFVCVDFSRGYYFRYFPLPQQTHQGDRTSTSVADSSGMATFFLHRPAMILNTTNYYNKLLPEGMSMYSPDPHVWAPLYGLQGLDALLAVFENLRVTKCNDRNGARSPFMVGSIVSLYGPTFEGPMNGQVFVMDASSIVLEGLQVHDDGLRIRFKWHNLITAMLHTYGVAG